MRYLVFILLCQAIGVQAQVTGKVSLDHLGIAFTIPEGWMGQPTDMGYILGSNTEAGMIFMTGHNARSIDELKQQAMQGIHEGATQLMPKGALANLTENSIGGVFEGVLEGQPVRAYAVGVVNPNGQGVSILAMTTPELYGDRYEKLAKEIGASVRFSAAKETPAIAEWKQTLTNARLTHMDSYQSDGGSYGGYMTGGGTSSKTVIDLCASGQFSYNYSSSVTIDTGGAFGGSRGGDKGSGRWEIVPDVYGNPILQLNFANGNVREYTLQYTNNETRLNGVRYFRTRDAACY